MNLSIKHTNLTETMAIEDYFEDKLWLRVSFAASVILGQIVTCSLYPCIIYYETNGGDPLKRTVLNQIISLLASYVLYGNIFIQPVWLYRLICGPVSFETALVFMFYPKSLVTMSALLAGLEYIYVRYFTICIWKGPAPLNELFFGNAIALINLIVTANLALIQNFGKLSDPELVFALIGYEKQTDAPVFK